MKRFAIAMSLAMSACLAHALTPLPDTLSAQPVVDGTVRVARELRPGVTYHEVHFANWTGDGPLAAHFLVVDWKSVDAAFTFAVVPGKDGNRSRPSDLAKGTNAIAAVNGVFHRMTDPYLAFYARKIAGVVSPSQHAGGDGCFAFNRGEMPYVGRFTKDVLAKYENVLSADGMPRANPKEAQMTKAKRQKLRAPRTFVGNVTSNRLTVLVVVDGRQGRSTGLTYTENRRLLEAWGCDQMTNLDGGGSSVMILKDVAPDLKGRTANGPCRIMNVPSDGLPLMSVERRVSESLMLLDGVGDLR